MTVLPWLVCIILISILESRTFGKWGLEPLYGLMRFYMQIQLLTLQALKQIYFNLSISSNQMLLEQMVL